MNKFLFKTTMFCQDIAKNIILTLFLAQRLPFSKTFAKIPKFEKMYLFSDINYGNTSTGKVSAKNYNLWSRYCQRGNSDKNLAHIWNFVDLKIAKFESTS